MASTTSLRKKTSLEARALPSRTRDLTLSRQNHYKGGLDAPPYEFRTLAVAKEESFRAIGSSAEQAVDVRFVSASNAPLERLLQSGGFRLDLYHRLCVFRILLPALRDRREDILLLAHHFLEKHALARRTSMTFLPGAISALLSYPWPGNVRELENTIVRALYLSQGNEIESQDLDLPSAGEVACATTPLTPGVLALLRLPSNR